MSLYQDLNRIQHLITQTALGCGRKPENILLLAVSKQQNIDKIQEAFHLGVKDFGESYFQEAQRKISALKNLPLNWHFIGPIQSNKTKGIATLFSWIHSISRFKIASQLNEYRTKDLNPLNVCIQINLIDEKSKSGIPPENAAELALAISQLPNLKLRGLMTIPPPLNDPHLQYDVFIRLNQLMQHLNQTLNLNMDTLSMGMSDDLIPAIKAGATIVRVGRAIFGERQKTSNAV
ncbi:YggS family pyridoxal phosphate-dependent enzyme [Legionella sainthelensi]|uniref:YggS family pyridoxal phosphate-dependent enzyme n=1 Tax=Legionella sainthelensi TaxID=28087 RepID=UPI000E201802|nr:YggS family pyridoxal phosphate-dependent enzyme [Legionella sainthelensi]